MPDQPKNSDSSRFEKLTKSVLETNHPFFGKIKKELPVFHNRSGGGRINLSERVLEFFKRKEVVIGAVIFASSFILSFFIYRQITDPFLDYRLGDVAQRHLIAPKTMELNDEETTEAKRKAATESILPVYDYDRRLAAQTRQKLGRAFSILRRQYQGLLTLSDRKNLPAKELENSNLFKDAKKEFSQALGIEVSDQQFEAVVRSRFSNRLERLFSYVISDLNLSLIVTDRSLLKSDGNLGITLNRLSEEGDVKAEMAFTNLASVIDLEIARQEAEKKTKFFLESSYNKSIAAYSEPIIALTRKLVVPNLTLNRQETEVRRKKVLEEIKPVIVKVNKGETIIKYGETINRRHLAILRQMEESSRNDNSRFQIFFTTLFLSVILLSIIIFLSGGVGQYKLQWSDLTGIAFLMVGTILLIKGVQFLATEALIEKFPQVPFDFYYYLIPVAAGPVMIRMLMDKAPALIYSVVLSVVGGILLDRNFFYAAYILASSLAGCALAHNIKTRSVVYRAGMITGMLHVVMISAIVANTRNSASLSMLWEDISWIFWSGMLSGVLMSVVVVAFIPLVELLSGRTSDLRLLELANMNHPLLRDLMVKAPGTYHHSIVIGSLVEAGAEAIGANPLMARVMAYYHDVGKMERPLYFIENQGGGYNKHDALQPHMSAMIIREHVKRGQELGYKFKLPQPIIDAMSEHHGSSTIWYFYNKARGQTEDPDSVLESDYKYDGLKPQSKETALVMLGDVVEAATRSVPDPTPLRLSGVVKNILNKYFAEGQLSDCDLTLRDLDLIAKSFLDVLLGIYHARIEYGVSSIKESSGKKRNGGENKNAGKPVAAPAVAAATGTGPFPKIVPNSDSGGSQGSSKS